MKKRKLLFLGIGVLALTGCGSSYSVEEAYKDAYRLDELVDSKILSDKGCTEVGIDYDSVMGSPDFDDNVATCKEGLKEVKETVSKLDKKMKGLKDKELKATWKSVKENTDSEIPFLEKAVEIYVAWGEYQKCYNSNMTTEKQILNCLQPMFDLKYPDVDKVFKGWAPLEAEINRVYSEFKKYEYGTPERKEWQPKLDAARENKHTYEKANEIYGNGNRLDLKKLAVKVLNADSEYSSNRSQIFGTGMEKIGISSFKSDLSAACMEEKGEMCPTE